MFDIVLFVSDVNKGSFCFVLFCFWTSASHTLIPVRFSNSEGSLFKQCQIGILDCKGCKEMDRILNLLH